MDSSLPQSTESTLHSALDSTPESAPALESTLPYKAPDDYKFHCFGGQMFIQVDTERFTNHTRTMFDMKWNVLDVMYYYPLPSNIPHKPHNLSTMLDMARALSKNCNFVRVDLYSICGQIIVGELTMTPEGGSGHFTPSQWDNKLGDLWI